MPDTHEIAITHLQRRKIEGRVLIHFIEILRERVGEDATQQIVDDAEEEHGRRDREAN